MRVVVSYGELLVGADLADALTIAVPMDFDGPQPNAFGAPAACAQPVRGVGFVGDVRAGGSVNCETLTLSPHCNGTHTECVGHVTDERIAVTDALHGGLWLAATITVSAVAASECSETTVPAPRPGDLLVTRAALERGLARVLAPLANKDVVPQALVVRTLPNGSDKLNHRYPMEPSPAYFSAEAAAWLVERGVRHLVVDLPSIDRSCDDGALTAHRIFWALAPGEREVGPDTRRDCTVTELAFIAPMVRDGLYLLDLQVPAFLSDAAPARPLLYPAALI
jgi:hypothetical protein